VPNPSHAPISDSMQMYLVTIARLREHQDPVPLSKLAEALSVSPVSVNEMCRKLQEQGLLVYQPYKGVSLTPDGEHRAHYILRRHRLWEVFLVGKLGMNHVEAHEAACQLEHSTPNAVSDRLSAFLGHPTVNPEGLSIPTSDGILLERTLVPLASLSAGQRGHVVGYDVGDVAREFLLRQGLHPGAWIEVMASTDESLLVLAGDEQVALALAVAQGIRVELEDQTGTA
jgi:DtxR family Mn-dependent transcriptional regulator